MKVSWARSSSNNFRVFTSAHWAGRWYQHHSHAQCMHIIHGLTLRLTVQADIQLWDKRRYLSSRKRGWGDNIPDKTEEKVRHRDTEKETKTRRDNETCMKNPKSWWERGAGESTLVLLSSLCPCFRACCILHGMGTKEFQLQTSSPSCNKDTKLKHTGNPNTLPARDHALHKITAQSTWIYAATPAQLRGKGSGVALPSVVTSSVK